MSQSSHDDHSPPHYFTTPEGPTRTRTITVNVWDDSMTMTTAGGVFSGTRLDPGTT
ncbi:methyltransferase, partial [Xanthomonas citri pv. citri]|nr:methyltransferase [Xanthomonas citri pv. citri]